MLHEQTLQTKITGWIYILYRRGEFWLRVWGIIKFLIYILKSLATNTSQVYYYYFLYNNFYSLIYLFRYEQLTSIKAYDITGNSSDICNTSKTRSQKFYLFICFVCSFKDRERFSEIKGAQAASGAGRKSIDHRDSSVISHRLQAVLQSTQP